MAMWFFLSLFYALWASISSVIGKRLMGSIHPLALILIGNLFIIPFMLTIIFLSGGIPKVSLNFYPLIIVSAILDVIAFTASFWAIKISPISLVMPISSFSPVFATVISIIMLNETSSITKLLGIIIIVLGAYILNIEDIKKGILFPLKNLISHKGVQLFFLANFIWGITPVFQKQAIFKTTPTMPLYASFFGILLVTVFISPFALKKIQKPTQMVRKNISWFLIIGIFATLSQLAAYTAFSQTNIGHATAIFKLSTLFTVLWGAIFFKEKHIKERLLGATVMILGTIFLVI